MRNAYSIGAVVMQSEFPNGISFQPPIVVATLIRTRAAIALLMLLASIGCARYASEPEINPRSWAPQAVTREWTPPPGSPAAAASVADYAIRSDRLPKDQTLALGESIGFALPIIRLLEVPGEPRSEPLPQPVSPAPRFIQP